MSHALLEKGAKSPKTKTLRLFTPKAPLWQGLFGSRILYGSFIQPEVNTRNLDRSNKRFRSPHQQTTYAGACRSREGLVARATLRLRRALAPKKSIAASASPGTYAARRSKPLTRKRESNLFRYRER